MVECAVKCPKCGGKICHLDARMIDNGILSIDRKGSPKYEWVGDIYGREHLCFEFRCPECGKLLFEDLEEAEGFLAPKKGKR